MFHNMEVPFNDLTLQDNLKAISEIVIEDKNQDKKKLIIYYQI